MRAGTQPQERRAARATQSAGRTTSSLCTSRTPSVSRAMSSARRTASLLGAVPLSHTTPSLSVSTRTWARLEMCSAASLLLILVVMAESFTNALGCERSVSESWACTAAPTSMPAAVNAATDSFNFMLVPPWGKIPEEHYNMSPALVPSACFPIGRQCVADTRYGSQFAVDGKQLEEVDFELLPGAARRLAVRDERLSVPDRMPLELRWIAGGVLLERDGIGVLQLRQGGKASRCLRGELAAVDDHAVLGVEPPR